MLPPAQPFAFTAGLLVAGRGLLKGFSLKETSATTIARSVISDGSAGGQTLAVVNLNADESIRDWLGESGVLFEGGVFVTISTGSIAGTVWVIPENRFEGFSFPSIWAEGAQQMSKSGGASDVLTADGDGQANATASIVEAHQYVLAGNGTWNRLYSGQQSGDSWSLSASPGVVPYGLVAAGVGDRMRTPAVFKQISALAVGAEATIWTPAAGKKFRLMGYVLAVSAAATLTLRDNTAGTIIRTLLLGTGVAIASPPEGNGTLSAAANNVLTATSSVGANLTGYVFGIEE